MRREVARGEEIFGPILPIKTYRTIGDAIAYVNAHARPLALYYFGSTQSRLDVGKVFRPPYGDRYRKMVAGMVKG